MRFVSGWDGGGGGGGTTASGGEYTSRCAAGDAGGTANGS